VIECGSLEYAHARLAARHGQRASEAVWQRLDTAHNFSAWLDAGRASSLRPWLEGIEVGSTSHRVEAVLRAHWRTAVEVVVAWMPLPWQPALAWCAALHDLPVLQHLATHEPMAWMRDDPLYRPLCAESPSQRREAMARGPFSALVDTGDAPHALVDAWHAEWVRRLPGRTDQDGSGLERLVRTLRDHVAMLGTARTDETWPLRRSLRARLSRQLRAATLEPAAAFVHLALCALDLERLRAGALRHLLFPKKRGA